MATLVLGIDLEGVNRDLEDSGVDLATDRVIEVGAIQWDWEMRQPVKFISFLLDESDRLPIDQELEELTGISEQILQCYACRGNDSIVKHLNWLLSSMQSSNYIMAHNGRKYDYPMLKNMFERYDISMPDMTWIDSATDIEYPKKIRHRSMTYLEHIHGFINPFPHRAITDVLAMFKIVSNYSLDRMDILANSPIVKMVAKFNLPNDWKDQNQVNEFNKVKRKVSKAGFRWSPKEKIWWQNIHKVLVDEGKMKFDFDTNIVEVMPPHPGQPFR